MKCPVCVKEDRKSTLYGGQGVSTCMGFQDYHDEEGEHHFHDPNSHTQNYRCSNGHETSYVPSSRCTAKGCTFGRDSHWMFWPEGKKQAVNITVEGQNA